MGHDVTLGIRSNANSNQTVPPIVVPASQRFDGSDGGWSTFNIFVGTPPQLFRVLPATNGQETWLPVPRGCTQPGEPDNCGDLRGAYIFNSSKSLGFNANWSSTWQALERTSYNLIMEENLGLTGVGEYGYDTIGIGLPVNGSQTGSGNHVMDHQVIAGVADPDFWIGYLPLSQKASNFSIAVPSYLSNLVASASIPSLSFGYTAGAQYQAGGALGSLTLGGYDASKMGSTSDMTFQFNSDDSRSFTVSIQSITAQRTLQGTVAPLASPIYSLIDSGVPDIWLPQPACAIFEQAFGLFYDNATDRYLVNETTHNQLRNLNSSLTFTIGNQQSGGPTVTIELPYAAFDLQAKYPIYQEATNYFPLRRAANSTQYTLGRTFLQEAYIVVDYERQNFSLSQVNFAPTDAKIIPITSINATDASSRSVRTHSLSTNAIAGISIAATGSFFILCLLIYLLIRHHRRSRLQKRLNQRRFFEGFHGYSAESSARPVTSSFKHELPGASPFVLQDQFYKTPKILGGSKNPPVPESEDTRSLTSSSTHSGSGRNGVSNTEPSSANPADIISPLSPSRTRSTNTRTELESPTSAHQQNQPLQWRRGLKTVSPQPRQELPGSSPAAEAHSSIWRPARRSSGGSADISSSSRRSHPEGREEDRSFDGHNGDSGSSNFSPTSRTWTRSDRGLSAGRSSPAGSYGSGSKDDAGSIGDAGLHPIYELSGESAWKGVRIKPVLRHYGHRNGR